MFNVQLLLAKAFDEVLGFLEVSSDILDK